MSTIIDEGVMVMFSVLDKLLILPEDQALGYARALADTNEKASLIFTNVVASRSTLISKKSGKIRQELAMKCRLESLTYEKFLSFLQSNKPGISNEEWIKAGLDLSSTSNKKQPNLRSSL